VVVLREQLRPGQWLAIAAAAAGVLFLTVTYGQLPWIALMLAFTFGFYGLLKKQGSCMRPKGWPWRPAPFCSRRWRCSIGS
jgi:chloramphenicol-sensitive protein RarD